MPEDLLSLAALPGSRNPGRLDPRACSPTLEEAALAYRDRGWAVLPLRPRDKRPALPSWAEFQKRLTSEAEVRSWWSRQPDANVGVVTGSVSRLIGIDVDGESGHELRRLNFGELPFTLSFKTGRGERQLYELPDGLSFGKVPVRTADGSEPLTILCDGCYTVMPPSVHASGSPYYWIAGRGPDDIELVEAPDVLLDFLEGHARSRGRSCVSVRAHVPGANGRLQLHDGDGRDNHLTSLAGWVRGHGYDEAQILPVVRSANDAVCADPLPEAGLRRIASSIGQRPPNPKLVAWVSPATARSSGQPLLVPIGELKEEAEPEWVWRLHIAKGCRTVVSAPPRRGKSVLVGNFIYRFVCGGRLASEPVTKTKVAIVTEEPKVLWVQRRERFSYPSDNPMLVFRPFGGARPTMADWKSFIDRLLEECYRAEVGAVVFDTIGKFWPVEDEQSAPETTQALQALDVLADGGLAVVVVHHDRKAEGEAGTTVRGSNAIVGWADIVIQMGLERQGEPGARPQPQVLVQGPHEVEARPVGPDHGADGLGREGRHAPVAADVEPDPVGDGRALGPGSNTTRPSDW